MEKTLQPYSVERGFTLIEALIATLVFSIALVGLISMQSLSARNSVEAEDRLTASILASDIIAVMWAQGAGNSVDEIEAWQQNVANAMPNGIGQVVIDADEIQVSVNWTPVWSEEGDQVRQYSTQVAVF